MKKCPRCKENKDFKDYYTRYDGASKGQIYCRECQKFYNKNKRDKTHDKIMKATNNKECWWVYQSILADISFRKD